MSQPNKISQSPEIIYDEVQGLCLPEPHPVCEASPQDNDAQSFFVKLQQSAFGKISPNASRLSIWDQNPTGLSPVGFLAGVTGCSAAPDNISHATGAPIASITSLGSETIVNSELILGKLNGLTLSTNSDHSVVGWSVFDDTHPTKTGTFSFIRSGQSGGSFATVSNDTSTLQKKTSAIVLDNGETVVAYTKETGTGEASSIVAKKNSSSGTAIGGEITILESKIREPLPTVRLIAIQDGFVAVYQDGKDLIAASFDSTGTSRTTQVLDSLSMAGPDANLFAVSGGQGNSWAFAELLSPENNVIQVRTFDGLQETGSVMVPVSIPLSEPEMAIALQEDGSMMLVWNSKGIGIRGAILSGNDELVEGPFIVRESGLAHNVALASDHHGNYVFSWEEGGIINGRIYNGTSQYGVIPQFNNIATGQNNFDVHASVTQDGILSFIYGKNSNSSNQIQLNIGRHDFQIKYK